MNLDLKTKICIGIIIAIIIALIVCIVLKFINRDNFADDFASQPLQFADVKNEELIDNSQNNIILFFDREGCPYSDKQREAIKNNNMMIGDFKVKILIINSEEGSKLAEKYNAAGTPTLVNPQNGNKSVGLKELDKHLEELTKIKNIIKLEPNKLHIVGREGCPFCTQMYDLCKNNNIDYESIESNTEMGRGLLEQYESNGVPLLVFNDKHKVGYCELSELKEMMGVY